MMPYYILYYIMQAYDEFGNAFASFYELEARNAGPYVCGRSGYGVGAVEIPKGEFTLPRHGNINLGAKLRDGKSCIGCMWKS